jgi:phosphinothricin acetyltransferase
MSTPTLRPAAESDLSTINEIYNYYVLRSTCTYQLEPESIADRLAWFREHPPDKYPVVVVEIDGEVVGWGSLSKWRPRAAMAPTVEVTVYVRHEMHRRGLGKMILCHLIERACQIGFHSIIGSVSADQNASISLQEGVGFRRVAHLVEVGHKFGQWLDLMYMQLMLEARRDT